MKVGIRVITEFSYKDVGAAKAAELDRAVGRARDAAYPAFYGAFASYAERDAAWVEFKRVLEGAGRVGR
jgi:hypothetical protein